jgi:tetraacyldisaccharide 4'-kinase
LLLLQTALEQARFRGPLALACAAAWASVAGRTVVRRLDLPPRTRVITVGGATLGGSGKTPLAMACAAELAARGARVALVGHAYRANPRAARIVVPNDSLQEVGDEALLAARTLGPAGIRVIVAPRRSDAVALAGRVADILVLDGVAQTSPVRAALALLAVDAREPWGRGGAVVPRGDLRAPKPILLRACDGVVPIADGPDAGVDMAEDSEGTFGAWRGRAASRGVWVGGNLRTWDDLAGLRLGLLCAIARPERVIHSLKKRGIGLLAVVRARDHGPVPANVFARAARAARGARGEPRIDLWLATQKCFVHFGAPRGGVGNILHAPIGAIDHALQLSAALVQRLGALAAP